MFYRDDRMALRRIEQKLDDLGIIVTRLVREEDIEMALIDDILADVQDEGTLLGSVETLLTNLSSQLADAIAANDPVKLQAIKDAIDANKARIAADVAAHTPAAPPTTPAP